MHAAEQNVMGGRFGVGIEQSCNLLECRRQLLSARLDRFVHLRADGGKFWVFLGELFVLDGEVAGVLRQQSLLGLAAFLGLRLFFKW